MRLWYVHMKSCLTPFDADYFQQGNAVELIVAVSILRPTVSGPCADPTGTDYRANTVQAAYRAVVSYVGLSL